MRDTYTNSIIKYVFLKHNIYIVSYMPLKQYYIYLHGMDSNMRGGHSSVITQHFFCYYYYFICASIYVLILFKNSFLFVLLFMSFLYKDMKSYDYVSGQK